MYDLELKPMHHDEGVNGSFMLRLVREGYYHYDPHNYHGPTLYYFDLPLLKLFGLSTFALRLDTVIVGLLGVALLLALVRHIGPWGALAAAAFMSLSPGASYYSRYFIHETLCVCFTLGIVVALANMPSLGRAAAWGLAALSAGLYLATKETSVITLIVLVVAAVVTEYYWRWRFPPSRGRGPLEDLKEALPDATIAAPALFLLLAVNILFYSSFFTNPQGVKDGLSSLLFWTQTGGAVHQKPLLTYVVWMLQEEGAVLILAAWGIVVALGRAQNRFVVFTAWWTLGILAAYSLVPYKTPWLILNILLPATIMAGYAVACLQQQYPKAVPVAVLLAGLGLATAQAVDLNFRHYDDETNPYVYVHTQRDFLGLVQGIYDVADKNVGPNTSIAVVSTEYWPLPWYLRDYTNQTYYEGAPVESHPILIVANESQQSQVESWFPGFYLRLGIYPLRPGVRLALYVRRDAPH